MRPRRLPVGLGRINRREAVRLIVAIAMLAAIVAGVVLVGRPDDRAAAQARLAGPEEVVFDWSRDACAPEDIPDTPARAFRDGQGQVQLIASHHANRRMVGPDLDRLARDCAVVLASDDDPDPARFNDREWLHALYSPDGNTVYALVHNEYQGHRRPGRCPSGRYEDCWYNTITLAVSTDGGRSYTQAPPPAHLVASIPYPYEPGTRPVGVFNPSNIVHRSADGYYYALLHVEQFRDQAWGTCVMRTRDLADPTSWRAWDGTAFNVRFVNPYDGAARAPRDHVCRPVARQEIGGMAASLTYNTYFGRFLLVDLSEVDDPTSRRRVTGVFYSLSDDLIHWSPRRLLLAADRPDTATCGGPDPIGYPAVLDPGSPSRNFETTGKRAYLYFTRFHYASCQKTLDRDLVRVPIEFSR